MTPPVTPVRPTADVLAAAVSGWVGGPVGVDGWRPPVQGAVGHVVGLRGPDDEGWVAKLFAVGAEGGHRACTEAAALRLLAPTGAPVPRLVTTGALPPDGGDGGDAVPVVVMERLPGARWADLRPGTDARRRGAVHEAVALLLRRLHRVDGERAGELVGGGRPVPADPADPAAMVVRTRARAAAALRDYRASGGTAVLARRAEDFLAGREHLSRGVRPVLCHGDVNGGNVLLSEADGTTVTGLVDLERASWDDPLRDLALTALHLWHHELDDVPGLLRGYGLAGTDPDRLPVHVLVLALAERAWVAQDRPQGWGASAARLDGLVSSLTGRAGERDPFS
ncbi:phosphotransferase family protein [Aquipuribacter hungaricus]|uniref:Phosphotransferase family protein n=1 Tax=Aquipuribacter hungaricus TaxID=545624 RepID=A0ABV7WGG1_9MICO